MVPTHDSIVPLSPAREDFFDRSGTLLAPCPATVAALLRELPATALITTEQLR